MAEIDIGDAVGAGFGLIRRRPLAVLAWGVLPMAVFLVVFLLFGGAVVAAIVNLARASEGGAEPPPQQILALIGSMFGAILILILVMVVVGAMLRAAVFRAELEPENSSGAYLRLGGQELWVFLSVFVMGLVIFAVQFALGIPIAIVAGVAAFSGIASGGGEEAAVGAMASMIGLRIVGQILISAVGIWLWLRLCLGPVMSFRERQFRLFESWAITKGHAWRMFLVMLVAVLAIIVLDIIVVGIGVIGVIATVAANAHMTAEAFFSQPPAVWMGALAPAIILVFVLGVLLTGLSTALIYAPVARMYRQLVPSADAAAAFA
jgi:hypothetical protein